VSHQSWVINRTFHGNTIPFSVKDAVKKYIKKLKNVTLKCCVTRLNNERYCMPLYEGFGKLAYNSLLVHNAACKDKKVCKVCSGWEKLIITHLFKNRGGLAV